jgi:hypothetical protein
MMKLSQWSWLLGVLSYVILGVLRRSGFLSEGTSLGTPGLITFLMLLLSAGIGIVLGVVSWKRKEANVWWVMGAIALNIIMALAGVSLVLAD